MDEQLGRLSAALQDRYGIERELGEGGMATVYLARDLKHKRNVALKVLKPELAAVLGAERFLAEIQTTANLQHPNILPLFDSGEADGFLYYVMPFVEGESLRSRLDRETQLPVDEAIGIGREVADALEYAHKHGVVHRDIKPANILIQDDRPVVGDFGIALAVHEAGSSRMTETGLSLGTPSYMSPEQASGAHDVDARTDVYSLGCTLYEMLVGQPPHTGSGPQAVLASVLTKQVEGPRSKRPSVPLNVDGAVVRALERLPADRFAHAKAFGDALADPAFRYRDEEPRSVTNVGPWRLATGVLGVALIALVLWPGPGSRDAADTSNVSRQRLFLSTATPADIVLGRALALAPDGSAMAFIDTVGGGRRLWLKEESEPDARVLAGTEGAVYPEFSPDGTRIAFIANNKVMTVSRSGGTPIEVADSAASEHAAVAWTDDGTITYVRLLWRLARVAEGGGEVSVLWPPADSIGVAYAVSVEPLMDASGVVFTRCGDGCPEASVHVYDFGTGQAKLVAPGATRGWHTPTGHLVLAYRDGTLSAVEYDLRAGALSGVPVQLVSGIRGTRYHPNAQVGVDGTLAYAVGEALEGVRRQLIWVDRSGEVVPVEPAWIDGFINVSLAPDDSRIAVAISQAASGLHLWVRDLSGEVPLKLSFEGTRNRAPAWHPDGRRIAYSSNARGREHVVMRAVDGSGGIEPVGEGVAFPEPQSRYTGPASSSWSADGRWIAFRFGEATAGDAGIGYVEVGVDTVPRTYLDNEHTVLQPTLSPEGRFISYLSDESGRREAYVRSFPDPTGGTWLVSRQGATDVMWSKSGSEIYFTDPDRRFFSAHVTTEPSFRIERVEELFRVPDDVIAGGSRRFDVTGDDRRFLMMRSLPRADRPMEAFSFILVRNWFPELRARVGGGG